MMASEWQQRVIDLFRGLLALLGRLTTGNCEIGGDACMMGVSMRS